MLLQPIRWFLWVPCRILLWLRYSVTLKGKSEVFQKPGPYLVLPNHPAYVDPPNVLAVLWPSFQVRPMLLETNFRSPFLAPFAWLLRAIQVPDTEKAGAETRTRAGAAVQAAIDALRAGQNVIIWPSGHVQRDRVEHVGGARTVADVLAAVPDVTAVLVRTRGLCGSMFSFAHTGEKPSIGGKLFQGALLLLANLGFFAPRRRVTMTLEAFTKDARPEPTRDAVNPWLEAWYNADVKPEEPTFAPYHFLFGAREYEFPPPPAAAELDLSAVPPEVRQEVAQFVEEKLKRPLTEAENQPATTFMQIGLDSLDAMEVTLAVEQRFGFTGGDVPTALGHLWALASGLAEKGPPKPAPKAWFAPPSDTRPAEIPGETLGAAFVNRALKNPKDIAAADDLAGAVPFEKMLVGAWAMSKRFREVQAPNVGLLLPAAVGADLAILGLTLAGKLPVVLNWTTGPVNLAHAARVMGLTHVVTSKAFIDRTEIQVEGTQYLFLEDVRATMGKFELLRRLLAVRFLPGMVRGSALKRAATDPHKPMVVLFTSGSEKAPKAVPLTHANIIADGRAGVPHLHFTRADVWLGFLPMFHSFGLTVCGLFPLMGGMKVVHHPDPTDAAALARKIASYKVTLLCGTPTFVGYILDRAKPGDLDSLRAIIVGAEKCPESVFAKAKAAAPRAEILEGYGITECSPVVAANPPGAARHGTVGKPMPGIECCVLDIETGEPRPQGEMGMLHVSGPTIFPGYIAHDGPQPFLDRDGKRWYVTGDLAALDDAGYIVFHGRLKRFLKAGGEMISLPALEEPFAKQYPPTEDGPRVAVEGVETADGRRVVLFTTEDVTLRDANAALQREGFRGVMRLDEVQKVDKIPVLGTGKTDYKVLRARLV